MDISYFSALWASGNQEMYNCAEYWDKRAGSFNEHKKKSSSGDMRTRIIEFITARCQLSSYDSALDIGCGAGQYALALARMVGQVEGFDVSPKMIDFARGNAQKQDIQNTHFQVLSWADASLEALQWEGAFSLVLASRTPAIGDKASLDKMIAASQKHCVLVTMAHTENSLREKLKKNVGCDERQARERHSFYCTCNLLWLMGYYPEVRYFPHEWTRRYSIDEAIETHSHFFERFDTLSAVQHEQLCHMIHQEAVDGMVHETVRAKIACVYWDVTEKAVF